MTIEFPKEKKKESADELEKFTVLKWLGIDPSRAGELLIEDLANERVNAVAWDELKSDSNKFNDYLKSNEDFWEELYNISKSSLKGNFPALVIIKESSQIIPCEIISIVQSAITKKIFNVIVLVDIIKWKNSTWKVTWEFSYEKSNVITNLDLLDKAKGIDIEQNIKEIFLKDQGYLFPLEKIDKDNIPVVEWKSLPNNMVFYEQAMEKAQTLSTANDIYIDQMFNAMTKRVNIDTSQATGGPMTAVEKEEKKLFFNPIVNIKSITTEEFEKIQALYQPSSSVVKDFRDNIDWLENKIREVGKSLKDDDDDSAQKSEIEMININRSATDALELNLAMWIKNLKKVIKFFDSESNESVVVDLKLRTIGSMMKETAKGIGDEANDTSQ